MTKGAARQNILHQAMKQGSREFHAWILRLFREPLFLFVTLWGHVAIFSGALAFMFFESGANPAPHGFFSAYYWAISTATTVGSADMQPVTIGGKCVAVAMMVVGSLFLWSYTALFAAMLVTPEVRRAARHMEKEVEEIGSEVTVDRQLLESLVRELEELRKERGRP